MKALLVIAHYFKAEPASSYSSTRADKRDHRQQALERVLLSWSGLARGTATLDIATKTTRITPGPLERLDIAVVVHADDHLIDSRIQQAHGLRIVQTRQGHPRMLPFLAHRVMADFADQYDWFFYSEDDLAVQDPGAFSKLQAFQRCFGPDHVLQPHRFELSSLGVRHKTYIDGDLRPGLIEPLLARGPRAQGHLTLESLGETLTLERARNPHAGFFALTAEQLAHWIKQPHFLDLDCSLISPLESAATLGIVKTFAVYKARAPHQSWFEIEHLDGKFSRLRLPLADSLPRNPT
jgi:hypothetical protein